MKHFLGAKLHVTDSDTGSTAVPWQQSVGLKIDVLFLLITFAVGSVSVAQMTRASRAEAALQYGNSYSVLVTKSAATLSVVLQSIQMDLLRHALGYEVASMDYFGNIERFRKILLDLKEYGVDADELTEITLAADKYKKFALEQVFKPLNISANEKTALQLKRFIVTLSEPMHDVINGARPKWKLSEHEAHQALDRLSIQLLKMDRAIYEHVNGNEKAEANFIKSLIVINNEVFVMLDAKQSDQDAAAVVEQLKDLYTRYKRSADMFFRVDPGSTTQVREAALLHSVPLVDGVRKLVDDMAERVSAQMLENTDNLNANMQNIQRDSWLCIIAMLGLLMLSRTIIGRKLIYPLRKTAELIDELRYGRRDLEIPSISTGDESACAFSSIETLQTALVKLEREQQEKFRSTQESHISELQKAFDELSHSECGLRRESEVVRSKNKELEQFIYVASHDLREPLKKLYSYCEVLEMSIGDKITPEQQEYALFIKKNSQWLIRLVDSLRTLTRVSKEKFDKESCDLQKLLYEVLSSRASDIDQTRRVLTIDKLPTIVGYPGLLHQAFANLIDNALCHSGDGGWISITVLGHTDTEVSLKFSNQKPVQSFANKHLVSNEESNNRLLLPFVRGNTNENGTGMGLAICKKIVERHNGQLWILNDKPHEFSVCISLPCSAVLVQDIDDEHMHQDAM